MTAPTSALQIHPVQEHDFVAWQALWAGYNETEGDSDFSDDPVKIMWARYLDEGFLMWSQVAELDGELVGLCTYTVHHHTWDEFGSCCLLDLYVAPNHRNKGIGRALTDAVADHGRDMGCAQLYWLVDKENKQARMLYDKIAKKRPYDIYERAL